MRAVEYEFQQSLPYRSQIVAAVHPDQLEDVGPVVEADLVFAHQQPSFDRPSAVNLKFLSLWPQARLGTSNSKPH